MVLRYFAYPSLNFVCRVERCEIWHGFSTYFAFESLSFENGAIYLKSNATLLSAADRTTWYITVTSEKTKGSLDLRVKRAEKLLNHQ